MKLQNLIAADHVFLHLSASDVETALRTVAGRIAVLAGASEEKIFRALLDRERLGSTSVGGGFAIPHCKLSGHRGIFIALARFEDGVAFGASDGAPVRFMFVVLSPPDEPAAHLQVLSQIARVLKRSGLRVDLLEAQDAAGAVSAVASVAESEGL